MGSSKLDRALCPGQTKEGWDKRMQADPDGSGKTWTLGSFVNENEDNKNITVNQLYSEAERGCPDHYNEKGADLGSIRGKKNFCQDLRAKIQGASELSSILPDPPHGCGHDFNWLGQPAVADGIDFTDYFKTYFEASAAFARGGSDEEVQQPFIDFFSRSFGGAQTPEKIRNTVKMCRDYEKNRESILPIKGSCEHSSMATHYACRSPTELLSELNVDVCAKLNGYDEANCTGTGVDRPVDSHGEEMDQLCFEPDSFINEIIKRRNDLEDSIGAERNITTVSLENNSSSERGGAELQRIREKYDDNSIISKHIDAMNILCQDEMCVPTEIDMKEIANQSIKSHKPEPGGHLAKSITKKIHDGNEGRGGCIIGVTGSGGGVEIHHRDSRGACIGDCKDPINGNIILCDGNLCADEDDCDSVGGNWSIYGGSRLLGIPGRRWIQNEFIGGEMSDDDKRNTNHNVIGDGGTNFNDLTKLINDRDKDMYGYIRGGKSPYWRWPSHIWGRRSDGIEHWTDDRFRYSIMNPGPTSDELHISTLPYLGQHNLLDQERFAGWGTVWKQHSNTENPDKQVDNQFNLRTGDWFPYGMEPIADQPWDLEYKYLKNHDGGGDTVVWSGHGLLDRSDYSSTELKAMENKYKTGAQVPQAPPDEYCSIKKPACNNSTAGDVRTDDFGAAPVTNTQDCIQGGMDYQWVGDARPGGREEHIHLDENVLGNYPGCGVMTDHSKLVELREDVENKYDEMVGRGMTPREATRRAKEMFKHLADGEGLINCPPVSEDGIDGGTSTQQWCGTYYDKGDPQDELENNMKYSTAPIFGLGSDNWGGDWGIGWYLDVVKPDHQYDTPPDPREEDDFSAWPAFDNSWICTGAACGEDGYSNRIHYTRNVEVVEEDRSDWIRDVCDLHPHCRAWGEVYDYLTEEEDPLRKRERMHGMVGRNKLFWNHRPAGNSSNWGPNDQYKYASMKNSAGGDNTLGGYVFEENNNFLIGPYGWHPIDRSDQTPSLPGYGETTYPGWWHHNQTHGPGDELTFNVINNDIEISHGDHINIDWGKPFSRYSQVGMTDKGAARPDQVSANNLNAGVAKICLKNEEKFMKTRPTDGYPWDHRGGTVGWRRYCPRGWFPLYDSSVPTDDPPPPGIEREDLPGQSIEWWVQKKEPLGGQPAEDRVGWPHTTPTLAPGYNIVKAELDGSKTNLATTTRAPTIGEIKGTDALINYPDLNNRDIANSNGGACLPGINAGGGPIEWYNNNIRLIPRPIVREKVLSDQFPQPYSPSITWQERCTGELADNEKYSSDGKKWRRSQGDSTKVWEEIEDGDPIWADVELNITFENRGAGDGAGDGDGYDLDRICIHTMTPTSYCPSGTTSELNKDSTGLGGANVQNGLKPLGCYNKLAGRGWGPGEKPPEIYVKDTLDGDTGDTIYYLRRWPDINGVYPKTDEKHPKHYTQQIPYGIWTISERRKDSHELCVYRDGIDPLPDPCSTPREGEDGLEIPTYYHPEGDGIRWDLEKNRVNPIIDENDIIDYHLISSQEEHPMWRLRQNQRTTPQWVFEERGSWEDDDKEKIKWPVPQFIHNSEWDIVNKRNDGLLVSDDGHGPYGPRILSNVNMDINRISKSSGTTYDLPGTELVDKETLHKELCCGVRDPGVDRYGNPWFVKPEFCHKNYCNISGTATTEDDNYTKEWEKINGFEDCLEETKENGIFMDDDGLIYKCSYDGYTKMISQGSGDPTPWNTTNSVLKSKYEKGLKMTDSCRQILGKWCGDDGDGYRTPNFFDPRCRPPYEAYMARMRKNGIDVDRSEENPGCEPQSTGKPYGCARSNSVSISPGKYEEVGKYQDGSLKCTAESFNMNNPHERDACKDWCSWYPGECKSILYEYCGGIYNATYPNDYEKTFQMKNNESVCGCFWPEEFYTNVLKNLQEGGRDYLGDEDDRRKCIYKQCHSAYIRHPDESLYACPNENFHECVQYMNPLLGITTDQPSVDSIVIKPNLNLKQEMDCAVSIRGYSSNQVEEEREDTTFLEDFYRNYFYKLPIGRRIIIAVTLFLIVFIFIYYIYRFSRVTKIKDKFK